MSVEGRRERIAEAVTRLLNQPYLSRQEVGEQLTVASRMDNAHALPAKLEGRRDAIEQKPAIEQGSVGRRQRRHEPRLGPPWRRCFGDDEQRTPHHPAA